MSNSIDCGEGLPFALMRWIKEQKEKEQNHQQKMVAKRAKEDKDLMEILALISLQWHELKTQEKMMVENLFAWKEAGKNFSDKQRGVITTFYMKHREKFG